MNLDKLKTEILDHLEQSGMAVFHGHARVVESTPTVYWDTEEFPEFKPFVEAAQTAGAKLMVFHQHVFQASQLDDAVEKLAECALPREDQREIEQRLKALRVYDGKTCTIELSFDHGGRVYLYDVQTEWYEDLSGVLEEIDFLSGGEDDDDDDPSIGGMFSRN